MSKVIMFSRVFPAYHPRAGEPTNFVEKILNTLSESTSIYSLYDLNPNTPTETEEFWKSVPINYHSLGYKYHTILAGHRFKVGDTFSPRVWLGKPYRSKQIIIAPDVEVKKIWNIELDIRGDFKEFRCKEIVGSQPNISLLAENDGLLLTDFIEWFNKPFVGQIICWSDSVSYGFR